MLISLRMGSLIFVTSSWDQSAYGGTLKYSNQSVYQVFAEDLAKAQDGNLA